MQAEGQLHTLLRVEEIEPRNGVRYSRQSGACIQTAMERLQALWFMRGRRKAAYSATTILS